MTKEGVIVAYCVTVLFQGIVAQNLWVCLVGFSISLAGFKILKML